VPTMHTSQLVLLLLHSTRHLQIRIGCVEMKIGKIRLGPGELVEAENVELAPEELEKFEKILRAAAETYREARRPVTFPPTAKVRITHE